MPERATYTEADLIAKLHAFEREHEMASDDFLARYEASELPFTDEYFTWASLCGRLGVRAKAFA